MKRFGLLVSAIAAVVVAFNLMFPSVTIRYRLTLHAEVDGKPAVGAGVVQVTYSKALGTTGADYGAHVRGEAIILNLPGKGSVFALLREGQDSRSAPDYIVLRAFQFPGGALPRPVEQGMSQVDRLAGMVELPFENLPMLIRFREANNPLTVERIDPSNLETAFGSGVKLTRVTLEIVPSGFWPLNVVGLSGVPISAGITITLPWLNAVREGNIDGMRSTTSNRLSNVLHFGHFKMQ